MKAFINVIFMECGTPCLTWHSINFLSSLCYSINYQLPVMWCEIPSSSMRHSINYEAFLWHSAASHQVHPVMQCAIRNTPSDIVLTAQFSLQHHNTNTVPPPPLICLQIKGLEDYLQDPVKRHIILSQLPARMRNQLLHERKYIFTFYEICTNLAQMGLLSFGKREYKVKEQVGIHDQLDRDQSRSVAGCILL